jgi:hypothetical protein
MATAALQKIAARLAAGAVGRTEADVQSDVRAFLLNAPLDLGGSDLVDVALEAQAGSGRRIDVEAGCAAIEVKKSLSSPTVLAAATEQLAGYVTQRSDELGQRYVGVLTDGQRWMLHHALPDGALALIDTFELSGDEDADGLAAWLEIVLATTDRIVPVPREILARLGAGSPAFELDLADLRALYAAVRDDPEVKLKRELWARLLVAALGTSFEATDDLFVTHTYLVLTAELLAHAVVEIEIDAPGADVRTLLEGHHFNTAGLHGLVEADFFDWPAVTPAGAPIVRAIARRVGRFDWTQVQHDVLKALYESVIDADTRRRLGEYYTPDWLAQRMVDEVFDDPTHQRLLDPSCGSGTFLFWAVRRALDAYETAGISNREALDRVVDKVAGIDLHPVAVTLARVTYLLAIGRERMSGERGPLTIPVFLGDSVRWEQDPTLLAQSGITIRTSDEMELIDQELHFPESVLTDPRRFDRLVAALADRAAAREPAKSMKHKPVIPPITAILNAHKVADADRLAVETVFEKLCRLHDAGRDHVWGYYIRNLARPLSFTRPDGRADVLVGNPPWLAYRNMPARIQTAYRALSEARGLWAGGKVATNQDLSDLFVARAVEQYLRPGGRFSFVMPFAVLSRRQYAGFRSADWTSQGAGTAAVAFDPPGDFARVKPPLFPVASAVVSGRKTTVATPLPRSGTQWTGRVPSHHATWAEVEPALKATQADVTPALEVLDGSPYRASFAQGATLVPSVLLRVEVLPTPTFGMASGMRAIRSARTALEKPPWRDVDSLEGVVESAFVHPMLTGASVVPFRQRQAEQVVVPWADGTLLTGGDEHIDAHPGLAEWWRRAERIWVDQRPPSSKMRLNDRIDFQRLLQRQLPAPEHRVVYTASGQHLAACRVDDRTALVEHKLYWGPAASLDEARYLTAVLNSRTLAETVAPLQSRGQHNPRDFDTHVFAVPFPAFEPGSPVQRRLVNLAGRAELVAQEVDVDVHRQFQRARRTVREALATDGVMDEIDAAVAALLEPLPQPG